MDRSSFCSSIWFFVARYLLDTSTIDKHFLNTYLDIFLDTSRYLICRALLKVLFKPPRAIWFSFHSISLLITLCFLSQTLSSHSNFIPQRFLQDFSSFSSFGKFLISHSSCISCFWDLGFGVFENFGVFQNYWVIFEILGWVFTSMSLKPHTLHHISILTVLTCI